MDDGRRTLGSVAAAAALVLMLTGCAGVNTSDASTRLTDATEGSAYAAVVEVQHPGAPWVNKVVIRLYVRDGSPEGVAAAVREAAAGAGQDAGLRGSDLTFIAYEGRPEDNAHIDNLSFMGSVSGLLGAGKGVEGVLDLTAADVQSLAAASR